MELEFRLPGLPPSINAYWRTKPGNRSPYVTMEGKNYRILMHHLIRTELTRQGLALIAGIIPTTWFLQVRIHLFSPHFIAQPRRKGDADRPSLTAGDIDNFVKIVLDASSATLGFNDAQVFDLQVSKFPGQVAETRFRISRTQPK